MSQRPNRFDMKEENEDGRPETGKTETVLGLPSSVFRFPLTKDPEDYTSSWFHIHPEIPF